MNTELMEYLAETPDTQEHRITELPTDTRWIQFTTFQLKGSSLGFCDSWCPIEAATLPLPPGAYQVYVECYAYGDEKRVAAVRVVPGALDLELGDEVGSFSVDVGSAGIIDNDQITQMSEEDYEEAWDHFCHEYSMEHELGEYACETANTTMVFLPSGFGDGDYSVFELRDKGKVVGAEARFITREERHPFVDDEAT